MINKLNILVYYFTHLMTKEIKKRFSFMIRKSIHKDLKNASTETELDMSDIVEAGIIIASEKSRHEIEVILGVK
jgi:hypothetical protein